MAESRPKSWAPALAPSEAAPWQDLPRELLHRILARLPANEVPCTARLVCKAAAAALSSPAHTTVRLSQPSPHGEFRRRWGAPGAMRPLTLDRRRRLLALTAASGCLQNLAWSAEHAGCFLGDSELEAAAAAGRPEACRWLLQQRGGDGLPAALRAAAGAGQRSTLEALLAHPGAQARLADFRFEQDFRATLAIDAARGGHVGLMDWLLDRFGLISPTHKMTSRQAEELLTAAATGCDLATLQRLHRLGCTSTVNLQLALRLVLSRAASSPTPDWRAKVGWIQTCLGAPLDDTNACGTAAACPDALERLTWLRARGWLWDSGAVQEAAGAGNVEALSYLLAEGCEVHFSVLDEAAEGGHLAALEVLHSCGPAATPSGWASAAWCAVGSGQLLVVRWMLERQLINLQQLDDVGRDPTTVLGSAAQSGSVELLALLHAGGCRWCRGDLYAAAYGGSEEALEWAVAHGCPMQGFQGPSDEESDPYFAAAIGNDWGTLACLRRLAVPWQPIDGRGETFMDAVQHGCGVPILRRLLELGCPVDWRQVAEGLGADHWDQAVRAWLQEEEERRRGA